MQKSAINVVVKAARRAGDLILRHVGRVETLSVFEKSKQDYASEVDAQAEAEIIRELKRAFPDHAFLAEESGQTGKSRYTWVIDPLDGTSNFLHGIPHFCVSIALLDNQEPVLGVIYDPLRNEIYSAVKGSGAVLNDKRIRVAQRNDLSGAMLITGFAPRQRSKIGAQLEAVRELMRDAEDVRRTGSAALDLAYVAAGRADAYFEAGGRVCDFRGGGDYFKYGQIVAGNLKVSELVQKSLVNSGYAAAFD